MTTAPQKPRASGDYRRRVATFNKGFEAGYAKAKAEFEGKPQQRAADPNQLYMCMPCSWSASHIDACTYPPEHILVDALGNQFCTECASKLRPRTHMTRRCDIQQLPDLDDEAVNRLSAFMKAKLAQKRAEGFSGWRDQAQYNAAALSAELLHHMLKGDPIDVAIYCMMLHWRGEIIEPPKLAPPLEMRPIAFEIVDHENGPRLTWVEKIAEESGHSYNGLYRRDATTVKAQEAEEPD
ncbi:hypothetical protein ASF91_19620 [Rhizobium sp. Leaf155]|nr:hypothetical protein ASF91_19620 [Rhizobium sp. Leaf155]